MKWKRLPARRWGLRQLGVMLLLGSYTAGHHLLALGAGRSVSQSPPVYLLALVAFLCLSAGCALVIHGHHLFDEVQVSERWRMVPAATAPAPRQQADEPSRDTGVDADPDADGASARMAFAEAPGIGAFAYRDSD